MTDVSTPAGTAPKSPLVSPLGGVSDFRVWISVVVVIGFFGAYCLNWYRNDSQALELMNGALIGQFTGAVGYWLGSSRSSDAKSSTLDTMATAVANTTTGSGSVVVPAGGTVDTTTTIVDPGKDPVQ